MDANFESMVAQLNALREENESLKRKATKTRAGEVTLKVSDKGAISVYGLGRFPVTLYSEQWSKLLAKAQDIHAFAEQNRDRLSVKPVPSNIKTQITDVPC